jgi:homoserine dehydrogenase
MSNSKTLNVVIFGIGNVGSTLINQIDSAKLQLKIQQNLNIRIPVVTNSKLAFYNEFGLENSWQCDFDNFSVPYKIEDVITYVQKNNFQNLVAIDATASKDFVQNYIPLIQNGFHIVSANKVANTLSFDFYEELRRTLKKYNKSFLYETNVGAGLPIIETVRRLHDSGEQIQKIRGVFSGSLSYIFNSFSSENVSFSDILKQANHLGLTEPDAREDLSGNDVARKLLILARELNLKTEFQDVLVESLVPKKLNGKTTMQQFNSRSKELDVPFQKLKQKLTENQVLRYVGELDVAKNTLEVKLISEERNSAIGQLKGTDSVFEIYSESYEEFPLVIQGAGAGKSVTARGLFSDIMKLSSSLN